MKHLISVDDLTTDDIKEIFALADRFQQGSYKISKQIFAANLFFEPSTRTKTSFIVAQRKLNIESLDFQPELSSINKGETLLDTVKTFEAIGANIFVIRHRDDEWGKDLIPQLSVPVINGGAGKKDHPTQSLLDAYTIFQEFKQIEGLHIVIAGDIKHSRVAHSSADILKKLGAHVYVSGPYEHMDKDGAYPYISIDEAVELADALMLLRIQHERHEGENNRIVDYHEKYGLTMERERKMKQNAIIMHPGPVNRGVEIDSSLVEAERSRIFKQMSNGVFIRMAIVTKLLKNWGLINENDLKKC